MALILRPFAALTPPRPGTGRILLGFALVSLLSALAGTARAADGADPSPEPAAKLLEPAEAPTGNGEIVERVVAVVNGDALFLSELRQRAVPFLPRILDNASSEIERYRAMQELYGELLTLLIDEMLIKQTAVELQVSVTRADVDRAIQNVQTQSELEEDAFWEAVVAQGFTRDRYRADVRRQLVRMKVINQKVRSRVNITDEDVRRRYEEMARKARRTARFHVAQIFLPADEESATALAEVRRRMEQIRDGLTPDNFAAEAAEHGGGDLGWVTQGDLPAELEAALLDLEVNEISAPVRGPAGFHVFFLKERHQGNEGLADYEEVRPTLHREMLETAMAKQEAQFLEELRAQGLVTRRL